MSFKKIANDALDSIIKKLAGDMSLTVPVLTSKEIENLIKIEIQTAFLSIKEEERQKLYKELSKLVHPDKLMHNNSDLYNYLSKTQSENLLFRIVKDFSENNFWQNIAGAPAEAAESLFTDWSKYFLGRFKRYLPPFNWLAISIAAVSTGLVLFATFAGFIAVELLKLVPKTINYLVEKIANFVTHDRYKDLVKSYHNDNFEENQKAYIAKQRKRLPSALANITDEELKNRLLGLLRAKYPTEPESFIQEKYLQDINDSSRINGFHKTKLLFKALCQEIGKSHIEMEGMRFLNVFVIKPLQVIAAAFLLPIMVVNELARFALKAIQIIWVAVNMIAGATIMGLLNLPLFIYDFLKERLSSKSSSATNEKAEEASTSNQRMAGLTGERPQSEKNATPPGHYDSPLGHKKDGGPTVAPDPVETFSFN